MKISSLKNNDKNKNTNSFRGKMYAPKLIGEFGKLVGEYISIPEQKLIQSTTALLLQPQVDLKFAEEDKKIDTAIKSASKAIAGGLTGVTIRGLAIKFFKKYIRFYDILEKDKLSGLPRIMEKLFVPEIAKEKFKTEPSMALHELKKYNETLGTIVSLGVMLLFTNSKIDVPLTSDLQDFIGGIVKEKKSWKKSAYDTLSARKQKITNWINKKKHFFNTTKDKTKRISKIIKEPVTTYKLEGDKK